MFALGGSNSQYSHSPTSIYTNPISNRGCESTDLQLAALANGPMPTQSENQNYKHQSTLYSISQHPPRHDSQDTSARPDVLSTQRNTVVTPAANCSFHCVYCGYQCKLDNLETFTQHLSSHWQIPLQYSCYHCANFFTSQGALQDHLTVHRTLNHHICSKCCLGFSNKHSFVEHLHNLHSALSTDMSLPSNLQLQRGQEGEPLVPQVSRSTAQGQPPQSSSHIVNARPAAYSLFGNPCDDKFSATSLSTTENEKMLRSSIQPVGTSSSTWSLRSTHSPSSASSASSSCGTVMGSPASSLCSPSSKVGNAPPSTFGQFLAKHIEKFIACQVADKQLPSLTSLMFMKAEDDTAKSTSPHRKSPESLMSLLDKVVEQTIRGSINNEPPKKPNLNFTVTFSDEEEEEKMETDEDGSGGAALPQLHPDCISANQYPQSAGNGECSNTSGVKAASSS